MTIIITRDLTGATLDWAVAKAMGHNNGIPQALLGIRVRGFGHELVTWQPSTDWSQGGPIIEREGILLRSLRRAGHSMDGTWLAMLDAGNTGSMVQWVKRTDWPRHYLSGPTPLLAAMRCYVVSKLGEAVDVPDELAQRATA